MRLSWCGVTIKSPVRNPVQPGPARSSPVRDCKRVWKQAFEMALTGVVTEALFWLRASKMRNPEVF